MASKLVDNDTTASLRSTALQKPNPESAKTATHSTPYLNVYFQHRGLFTPTYVFTVGLRENKEREIPYKLFDSNDPIELLSSRPVPAIWRDDMTAYISGTRWGEYKAKPIGYMVYQKIFDLPGVAYSTDYYPRSYLGKGPAKKLPYFIEAIVTNHLKVLGFTRMDVGCASPRRLKQLELAGIRKEELYRGTPAISIDLWLKSMGRGIRMAQEGKF